jgi:hypothetical protein
MADQRRDDRSPGQNRQDEYIKGGKGRKDEVGGSGIYPASSSDAPADAQIRSEGGLVGHKGPRPKATDEEDLKKADQSSGSE